MSAFRVDKHHIDALVCAGMSNDYAHAYSNSGVLTFDYRGITHKLDSMGGQEIGAALVDLNNRSVNTLYREDIAPEPYEVKGLNVEVLTPVVILSLIAGFRYQACEFVGWDDTLGAQYLRVLEKAAIHALSGYDNAPWTLDENGYRELLDDAGMGAPRRTA